ncbi:hypothetical protein KKH39_04290 [Patescibacteria group bacterium]|nr:hypothetical protein [Patescibacteria group bacterium]
MTTSKVRLLPQGRVFLEELIRLRISKRYDLDEVVEKLNAAISGRKFNGCWAFIEFGIAATDPQVICLQFTQDGQPGTFTFSQENIDNILAEY